MTKTILNKAVLSNNDTRQVDKPKYDPSKIRPGFVHIGVGNFFRAHLAYYVHEMLNELLGSSKDSAANGHTVKKMKEDMSRWGIIGGAVTDHTYSKKVEAWKAQQFLYTLVEENENKIDAKVIASLIDCLPYQEDMEPLRNKLMDPETRIVSMTVTEGGYFLNEADQSFDPDNESIRRDIDNPRDPKTIFGLIVQTLRARRVKGIRPYTVMSCDNVPHNGDKAKEVVLGLAKEIDNMDKTLEPMAPWIEDNVCFPNSMVDCITPSTGPEQVEFIEKNYGFRDDRPVFSEPYRQFVLEDNFVDDDRPPFESVGVQMVKDVTPWEIMKLRILNGGHASMSYPAALMGLEYVHNAAGHEVIGKFLDVVQRQEVIPIVPEVPGVDLHEYWDTTFSRYKNPTLKDSIDRNCGDGSNRQPKFIVQPIEDNLERGNNIESVAGLALVSAMWCRYCQGTKEDGTKIDIDDPIKDTLVDTAQKAKTNPRAWLEVDGVYGNLADNEDFVKLFAKQLDLVQKEGVETAMKEYIEAKKH